MQGSWVQSLVGELRDPTWLQKSLEWGQTLKKIIQRSCSGSVLVISVKVLTATGPVQQDSIYKHGPRGYGHAVLVHRVHMTGTFPHMPYGKLRWCQFSLTNAKATFFLAVGKCWCQLTTVVPESSVRTAVVGYLFCRDSAHRPRSWWKLPPCQEKPSPVPWWTVVYIYTLHCIYFHSF